MVSEEDRRGVQIETERWFGCELIDGPKGLPRRSRSFWLLSFATWHVVSKRAFAC